MREIEPPEYQAFLEELLTEREWLGSLARRLCACEADANDLEHETLVAALRNPPERRSGGLRPWLSTVLHNARTNRLRKLGRDRYHERAGARAEAQPDTADEIEQQSTRRAIADFVLGLPELDRDLVLNRFYEGRSLVELAREAGVPRSTLQSRLEKALKRLRTQLEVRYGGSSGLLMALTPLCFVAPPPRTTSISPVFVKAAGASCGIGVLAWISLVLGAGAPSEATASPAPAVHLAAEPRASEPFAAPHLRESAATRPGLQPPAPEPAEVALVAVESVLVTIAAEPGPRGEPRDVRLQATDALGGHYAWRPFSPSHSLVVPPGLLRIHGMAEGARVAQLAVELPALAPADQLTDGQLAVQIAVAEPESRLLKVLLQQSGTVSAEAQQTISDGRLSLHFAAEEVTEIPHALAERLPGFAPGATPTNSPRANLFPFGRFPPCEFRVDPEAARYVHLVFGTRVLAAARVPDNLEPVILELPAARLEAALQHIVLGSRSGVALDALEVSVRPSAGAIQVAPRSFRAQPILQEPGRIELEPLPPVDYLVFLNAPEQALMLLAESGIEGSHIQLDVPPQPWRSHRVRVLADGDPIGGARVRVDVDRAHGGPPASFYFKTDALGEVELPALAGTGRVQAWIQKGQQLSTVVSLPPQAGAAPIELELAQGRMRQFEVPELEYPCDYLLIEDLGRHGGTTLGQRTFDLPTAVLLPGEYRVRCMSFTEGELAHFETEIADDDVAVRLR